MTVFDAVIVKESKLKAGAGAAAKSMAGADSESIVWLNVVAAAPTRMRSPPMMKRTRSGTVVLQLVLSGAPADGEGFVRELQHNKMSRPSLAKVSSGLDVMLKLGTTLSSLTCQTTVTAKSRWWPGRGLPG